MSPPSVASADRRHRSALQRRGWQRPDRQAARLDLSRRHRHELQGRFTTITTTGPGATRLQLDRFLQIYAVEKARIEARKKGHQVTEQALADGSIKLTITVGGGRHEDHRDHRRHQGAEQGRDPRLHRRRVPRKQASSSSRPLVSAPTRKLTAEFLPGPDDRPAAQAVELSDFPARFRSRPPLTFTPDSSITRKENSNDAQRAFGQNSYALKRLLASGSSPSSMMMP